MSFMSFILKKIVPIPKLLSFEKYLFIGPHPDDIEVGAGATVALLKELGKKVSFVIATDGCYGAETADYDKAELIATRQAEAKASAALLGVTDVTFLPFADGGLYDTRELTTALLAEIVKAQPDVVFCPDFHLKTECHADHINTGKCAANAYLMSGNAGLAKDYASLPPAKPQVLAFYYTDSPNTYIGTKKRHVDAQYAALKLFPSQFTYTENSNEGSLNLIMLYNKFRSIRYGIKTLKGHADAYRCLGPAHTHCCSEKI